MNRSVAAMLLLLVPVMALAADAPMRVGAVEQLTAAANPDAHYKLYLPTVYDKDVGRIFPLLINQNPSGKTRIDFYVKWAEAQGAIVLGIDGISNGKEQGKKNIIADAVLADLVARGIRVHPTLRITIGMSGGSADGMRLVRRKPENYAGCVFMGAGGVIDNAKAKHLAYAILGGAKDEWMPGDACYAMVDKARGLGCQAIVEVDVNRQHHEAELARQYAALTWILELQKLQLPSLTADERKANMSAAHERMKAVSKIAEAAARRDEARLLLDLAPLKEFAEDRQAVAEAWAGAVIELAEAEKDAIERHAMVMTSLLRGPQSADLSAERVKALEGLTEKWRSEAAVARDWKIRQRYLDTEDAECHAGLKPENLAKVLPMWEALAPDAAGTPWEAKVARRIDVVKQFIENPSTLQSPTKVK